MTETQRQVSMLQDFGKQYAQDDDFKAKARLHQSKYRVQKLNAEFAEYGNRLAKVDALAGKNFYAGCSGLFAKVQERFSLRYTPLYSDMLRSQHIPWNLFGPLMFERDFALAMTNALFGVTATEIDCILIEHAPHPREQFLNDNTSFDAYVQYIHKDGQIGAVGVEVKYTEREYPYGATEGKRMFNLRSHYHAVSNASGLYKEGAYTLLRTKKLKQLWRNHLLGESMLQRQNPTIKHFTSAIIFPAGNAHCSEACVAYSECLKSQEGEHSFVPVTFERFIESGKYLAPSERIVDWLKYLEERYIVVEIGPT